jgi:hypothetical protein
MDLRDRHWIENYRESGGFPNWIDARCFFDLFFETALGVVGTR